MRLGRRGHCGRTGGLSPVHLLFYGPAAPHAQAPVRNSPNVYCAPRGTASTRETGGGFHCPVSASSFGAYSRIVRLNGPFGAGSQFASLPGPGFSFWNQRSSDPSGLVWNGIQLLTAKRFSGFATWKPSESYSVTDQNALTGGVAPLSKCSTYLPAPSSGVPASSPRL